MTRRTPSVKAGWLTALPFAHRGLHDGNRSVPENSLAAAHAAIEAGYGIECDLQFCADGVPIVFHDDELERLTGRLGSVRDLTSQEATALTLCGSGEPVPLFAELLALVAGRVPLLVELKACPERDATGFVEAVVAALQNYDGPLALMSFDYGLVDACRSRAPSSAPVGLTAEGSQPDELSAHDDALAKGLDFVSFDHAAMPNAFLDEVAARGLPILCWTIRSEAEASRARQTADQITFEGFRPSI
ncbi:MAG: glycerophosphodiester phosphodiesterase [Fulvimarina manganoxydans]|uniref:glycerophosphodiester phosphodiesterase family protein n=1 Tax=Fulvimarina manganoxydans TaxID=937218 RepID=UPI002353A21E|nr:glycerophosphodiester phosphodiesterase family protein [Fulvimarina manganoxydans]MCK5933222.1 glycerophosphodiester phosphodiesterase [Fulvimarina manganoxydans]